MVNRSPLGVLLSEQIRYSCPTFLKGAMNVSKFFAQKYSSSKTARSIYHGFRNWYEGGWPIWTGGKTSYLPSLVQDARWDQNYVTRREMLRRMRYWSQNSSVVESALSIGERYTVGTAGLSVAFYPNEQLESDADDSWYEQADAVISEWFQNCGWNGESMQDILKIAYRCQKIDGDVFILKTRKKLPLDMGSRTLMVPQPTLQIVEGHRVESPWNQFEQENITLIDGVQFQVVNVDGRQLLQRVGFWVRAGQQAFEQNDSWVLVKDDDCWQLRNVHRADQPRSVSDFYACEVILNKLEDLLDIELGAAESQSVRAVGIETNSGLASSPLDKKLMAVSAAMGQKPPADDAGKEFQKRLEMFREETGAYAYGLKTGEKIHFDSPVRPSEATLNLWEFLIHCICAATHNPRCLVFEKISAGSSRSQGTEVRAQLDCADAYYKGDFQKWKNFLREVVIWRMEWSIKNDRRVVDPPANWRDCIHIHQPEACNVDVGYNTQAQLMSLAAGTMDYDMILGPQGESFVTVIKRLARQQKLLEKLNVKVTLPALMKGQIPLDGMSGGQQQESQQVNQ